LAFQRTNNRIKLKFQPAHTGQKNANSQVCGNRNSPKAEGRKTPLTIYSFKAFLIAACTDNFLSVYYLKKSARFMAYTANLLSPKILNLCPIIP